MDNKHLINGYVDDDLSETETDTTPNVHYPTCRFCGKTMLPTALYASPAIADEATTMACDCAGAHNYRREKEKKEKREKNIIKLQQGIDEIAEYCESRNITITAELNTVLAMAGTAVIDGHIAAVQLKFARATVSISKNSKGVIIIKAAYSAGAQIEV